MWVLQRPFPAATGTCHACHSRESDSPLCNVNSSEFIVRVCRYIITDAPLCLHCTLYQWYGIVLILVSVVILSVHCIVPFVKGRSPFLSLYYYSLSVSLSISPSLTHTCSKTQDCVFILIVKADNPALKPRCKTTPKLRLHTGHFECFYTTLLEARYTNDSE